MSALKQVRAALNTALKESLGKSFALFPDPNTLKDTVTKPTLILIRSKVEKLAAAPLGFYNNSLTLVLIDSRTDSEDHLDDLLDEVLEALDEQANVSWSEATRATYNSTNPSYEITLTAHSNRKA